MKEKTICLNSKVNGRQPSLQYRIYSAEGAAPAVTTCFHPFIALPIMQDKNKIKQVGQLYDDADRSFKNPQCGRVDATDGLAPTLNTCGGGQREPKILLVTPHYSAPCAIRKLTPRECMRLMDVRDHDIDKMINAGISNTQLRKLAGNSIVVEVIYQIFKNLLIK